MRRTTFTVTVEHDEHELGPTDLLDAVQMYVSDWANTQVIEGRVVRSVDLEAETEAVFQRGLRDLERERIDELEAEGV